MICISKDGKRAVVMGENTVLAVVPSANGAVVSCTAMKETHLGEWPSAEEAREVLRSISIAWAAGRKIYDLQKNDCR